MQNKSHFKLIKCHCVLHKLEKQVFEIVIRIFWEHLLIVYFLAFACMHTFENFCADLSKDYVLPLCWRQHSFFPFFLASGGSSSSSFLLPPNTTQLFITANSSKHLRLKVLLCNTKKPSFLIKDKTFSLPTNVNSSYSGVLLSKCEFNSCKFLNSIFGLRVQEKWEKAGIGSSASAFKGLQALFSTQRSTTFIPHLLFMSFP